MWKWTKTEYRVLSQFANFSKHSEVLNSFKNELPVLNELRDKPDGCRQMVEAVYNALAKKGVQYSLEEYDSSQDSQQIRTPDEILVSKNQGTCLDLAVLFCGMCLRYELIPLLIVSGNHAWVAVSLIHWLHECKASDREGKKLFEEGLLTDEEKVAELCNLVEDEEAYIAIECTGFTQESFSKSFNEAQREGLKRLRNFSSRNGGFILDVPIAHDFYWRDLCTKRLENEPIKRLINSPLTNGGNPLLKLYVPLGLIERKPDAQRRPSENDFSPEGSSFNKPDAQYEVVLEYKDKEFFDEVLQQKRSSRSQGKRLAIVGDPGGGKTTLLQRIAYWVLEEEEGLPIWVPLSAVTDDGCLYRYLSENWLRNIAREPEKTPIELQQAFKELLKSGQVWLLLDGADEMASRHPLTRVKEQLDKGWADSVRVILNCRLNLWEVEKEALWEKFDIYRTLDFSYPEQVHEFINKRFGEDYPAAKRLQDKLAEENRKRLQDLVKNPLRLALLCRIWKEGLGTLPDTKADFYRLLVENHYKWKDDSTNKEFEIPEDRKKELNQALGQLARDAIDSKDFRFRLRESSIRRYLKDPNEKFSLFGWALKLGWLLDVGFPTEGERNRGEKVYAFFHPTFQEYFAATVDDNYGFFLPSEHRYRPVKDKNNPEKYERYRIFERQWKEVILLWLGRPEEEVSDKQKEDFIKALVEFEDGCSKFYGYRAYFLAAAGIAEFRDCNHNIANEIVEQIVKWSFGSFNSNKKWMTYIAPIQVGARAVLLETEPIKAIDALVKLIQKSHNISIIEEAINSLGEIGKGNPKAIKALESLIQKEPQPPESIRMLTARNLGKIDRDNPKVITELVQLTQNYQNEYIPEAAINSLGEIGKGNRKYITALEQLILPSQPNFIRIKAALNLGKIDEDKSKAVNILVELIDNYPDRATLIKAIDSLGEIGRCNQKAISTLKLLIQKEEPQFVRIKAALNLGKIDKDKSKAVDTLVEIIQNPEYQLTPWEAIKNLAQIGKGIQKAVDTLVKFTDKSHDLCTRWQAALSLGKLDRQEAVDALVKLIDDCQNPSIKRDVAECLGEIDKGNSKAIAALVQLIEMYQHESIGWMAAESLAKIDRGHPKAIAALIKLIHNPVYFSTPMQALDSLKGTLREDQQMKRVVLDLKDYLSQENRENDIGRYRDCYELIWHCAQNMTYPDFYQAWHQQEEVDNTTTPNSQSLNQDD
jgi:HEAT repeat protein/energy-coupling factor transporter ATP-binding protein EcfA2